MFKVGHFQQQSVLEIHSRQAEDLVKGRRVNRDKQAGNPLGAHRIIGLKTYSALLARVYQGAKMDDPYADMLLIEVERRISNALAQLTQYHTRLDQQLEQQLPGIAVNLCESKQPLSIPLNFSTPHAYLGARLTGEYDLLVRKMETCKRLGLLNSQCRSRYLRKVRRLIRGVFLAPAFYKPLVVSREDIANQTPNGEAAIQTLGAVPADVLNRERRPEFGPY